MPRTVCTSRGVAAGLELAAQLADEDVDHVGVDGEVVAPDELEQPLAAEHDAGVAGEGLQQVELPPGELDRLAVDRGAAAGRVDRERPDGQPARPAAAGHAAAAPAAGRPARPARTA